MVYFAQPHSTEVRRREEILSFRVYCVTVDNNYINLMDIFI